MSDSAFGNVLHPALRAVKQRFSDQLHQKFATLFDSADDTLFSMSGAGQGADAQGVYFDALRQLRIRKDDLTQVFRREFDSGFAKALGLSRNVAGLATEGKLSGLSLVGHGDLEESLAITNMVERAQRRYADALYALAQRFNALLAGAGIDERSLPVGPQIISEAFRAVLAQQADEFKIEIRLVLLKLFDKSVLQELGAGYDDANTYFAEQGVLPEIKVVIRKQADASPAAAVSAQASAAPAPESTDDGLGDAVATPSAPPAATVPASKPSTVTVDVSVFENLTRVFAQQTQGTFSSALLSQPGLEVSPESNEASAQATKQLIAALSQMQAQASVAPTKEALFGAGLAQLAVATLHGIQKEQGAKPVSLVDANTIDIVSMLFNYILDDATIPGSLRALISKLQLPYLKVGLLDKSFFNSHAHPARRLLNELAQAGMGWREADDPKDDPLYKKVSEIVERIARDFVDDVAMFQGLLDEFLAFLSDERAMDETKELIIGKSRNDVRETIEAKLAKQNVPAFVREFLIGPWKEVLVKVHEKKGFRSDTWNKSVQTVDELIASVQAQSSAEQRARLLKQLPVLLNVLRAGLKSIGFPDARSDTFFQNLEHVHMAVLHGKNVKQALDAANVNKKPAPPAADGAAATPEAKAKSEAEAAVKRLQTGDWVEFTDAEGNGYRGKLIWRSDVLDDFTFVNRAYKVVAERCAADLVQEFLCGKARRLENVPLIDRALDAVIKGVKG